MALNKLIRCKDTGRYLHRLPVMNSDEGLYIFRTEKTGAYAVESRQEAKTLLRHLNIDTKSISLREDKDF